MGDTAITIFAIFLAAILLFVVPMMTMADRSNDVSQLAVQTATTKFVDNCRNTGKITLDNYEKFVEEISSTGNAFDVEMEIQVLDENLNKKGAQTGTTKIGENVYYSIYTTQILEALETNSSKTYKLKEGDIVSVKVRNTNETLAQTFKNFFGKVAGSDTYELAGEYAGTVTVNGN